MLWEPIYLKISLRLQSKFLGANQTKSHTKTTLLWFEVPKLFKSEFFLILHKLEYRNKLGAEAAVWLQLLPINLCFKLCTYTIIFVCCLVTQSYRILCNPMDCSLPGSSAYGILQARIPEWVAISFSRWDLPNPWIKPGSPEGIGRFFYHWATGEALYICITIYTICLPKQPNFYHCLTLHWIWTYKIHSNFLYKGLILWISS